MKILNVIKDIRKGELPSFTYMFKRIWGCAGQYSKEYGVSKIYLFVDYFWCAIVYGCTGNDYFLYRFFSLRRSTRRKFITEIQEDKFEKKHTNAAQEAIIEDKEKSFIAFPDYMKRTWCGVKYNNSDALFKEFYNKHDKCIVKPIDGHGGRGVELLNIKERFERWEAFLEYCVGNKLLVEELIPQHETLNKMYPNAINTIRMVTLKGKLIGASLRMGVGGASVDNAHSGGIFAEVDVNEGVVVGAAMRYTNERFICHPTTGTVIPGFKIPCWNECVAIVEEASKLVSDVYLIGWDVAVTPDGPTLVEVNTHPGLELVQAPNGHGLKAEFEKIKD